MNKLGRLPALHSRTKAVMVQAPEFLPARHHRRHRAPPKAQPPTKPFTRLKYPPQLPKERHSYISTKTSPLENISHNVYVLRPKTPNLFGAKDCTSRGGNRHGFRHVQSVRLFYNALPLYSSLPSSRPHYKTFSHQLPDC